MFGTVYSNILGRYYKMPKLGPRVPEGSKMGF
jgi:hypothetical protein